MASRIDGTSGDDVLTGTDQADEIYGYAGDDRLAGGAGADVLDGGEGFDTVSYGDSTKGVTVNLATGIGSSGTAFGDTLVSIEAVEGSAYADTLIGSAAAETLRGGQGDDVLRGGAGADTLDGGAGFDTVSFADSTKGVRVNLAAGSGTAGTAFGDHLISIEAVEGSAHADILLGSAMKDTLRGGGGDDTVQGGAGADTLDGGGGFDLASYSESNVGVRVNLATGTGLYGTAHGDVLISIEAVIGSRFIDVLTGTGDANVLRGGDGDDFLLGEAGDDTLDGGNGNDTLDSGAGADELDGGAGFDTARYGTSTLRVIVDLSAGTGVGGTAAGDTLVSIEAVVGSAYGDTLIGNSDANILDGGGGRDILRGGGGNDVLDGGSLEDTLDGGAGDDVLAGGSGSNTLDGGDGHDRVSYDGLFGSTMVNLATGTASSDRGADTLISIESVTGGYDDDTLIGNAAANTLAGGGGADVLTGGGGADRFVSSMAWQGTDQITDFSHAQGDRIDLSAIDADGNGLDGDDSFTFIGTAVFTGVAGQVRYAVSGGDAVIAGDINGDGVSDLEIVLSNVGSLQESDFVL
ncbi:calcium-binding protein [Inquilinus sp. Marseille-Q2685]|uniref:calcium-binding protein n=1 Tax=Inquilinus sp. Marseille-Q2685 TaxID=2866581 RepID=UPI001CE3D2F0|nr:calcium-binding protein [Inquilinus sp. Marseille-Q2685]